MKSISVRVVESSLKKGVYKVWVQPPVGPGYFLRMGHAWKTKQGADDAAQHYLSNYPLHAV